MRKKLRERKAYCIDLLGGKCVKCEATEYLEFDHINPETREFSISQGYSYKLSRLEAELKKCQLLCRPCHVEKTMQDYADKRTEIKVGRRIKVKHGSTGMYMGHKCRCFLCKNAMKKYNQQRYRLRVKNMVQYS